MTPDPVRRSVDPASAGTGGASRPGIALSVVLPVYNGERTIGAQLDSLAAQYWEEPWELVVADNGSTDRTREIVRRFRGRIPGLRIVAATDRRGPGHACNRGAEAARGRSLAFCDADDVAGTGWLAAIGRALDRFEFVASRHECRRLNPDWVQGSRRSAQTAGLPCLWYPPYCPHAGCCGLGVRRSLFLEVGGFDEGLRYLQETDLCVRLFLRGVELTFVADALMHVRYRSSLRALYRQSRLWSEYNVRLYRRYRDLADPVPGAWRAYGRAWRRLLRRSLAVRTRSDAARALWALGRLVGLTRGSLRHCIEPPIVAGRRPGPRAPGPPSATPGSTDTDADHSSSIHRVANAIR